MMPPIENEGDEIESQAKAFSPVSVRIGDDLKPFHEGYYIFDKHSYLKQFSVHFLIFLD
jgi:hypothetical protein